MRILLLSQFFNPEPTFKGLPFAKELARRGHKVEVLTGFPNYPGGRVYPGYKVRPLQRETLDGIPVVRTALYPSHDKSPIRRILNYGTFAASAATLGACAITQPDVVYAYHPPATVGLPSAVLRNIRRVPIVGDIQDLWPDTVLETGMLTDPLAVSLLRKWCRFTFQQMDQIVVLSPGFKSKLVERGIPADKIEVIYNWCYETPAPNYERIDPSFGFQGNFNILFAGTMGMQQGLNTVLDAARLCEREMNRVQFVFVGGGIERETLERRTAEMKLSNVRFLPRQPAESMAPLLAAADVLLVHLRDLPLFRITIPSKTQAYLAAGRPILMAVRGDAADLVRQAGAGICCDPENPPALVEAIRRFAGMSPQERNAMGASGARYYQEKLSLRAGVDRFEAVFQKAARLRRFAARVSSPPTRASI